MNRLTKKALIAASLAVAFWSGSAAAVTLNGTNVSFTFDSDLLGLFGTPIVSGDSLVFTPTSFSAVSNNGAGFVLANQTINVEIRALTSSFEVSTVSLVERGDYYLVGADAQVGVSGQIRMFDLDDPINNEVTGSIVAAAPFNVVSVLPTLNTVNWQSNASATAGSGWGGVDGMVSGVNLTIENLLFAKTLAVGSSAFIEKKFAGTTIVITAVPEAHTYGMMMAGLGLVGFMARRKSRSHA